MEKKSLRPYILGFVFRECLISFVELHHAISSMKYETGCSFGKSLRLFYLMLCLAGIRIFQTEIHLPCSVLELWISSTNLSVRFWQDNTSLLFTYFVWMWKKMTPTLFYFGHFFRTFGLQTRIQLLSVRHILCFW